MSRSMRSVLLAQQSAISAVTFGMKAGGRDVGRGDDCAERDCREQPGCLPRAVADLIVTA